MKTVLIILFIVFQYLYCKSENKKEYNSISADEYQDAVYASWIGQIIGNTYGLGYEFKFIDATGPNEFPYGYGFTLQDLIRHNGAYSDDDTDIEYMYLIQMEKYGIEPTYQILAEAWKKHVKERIWFANRMAVTLMHAGHYPPVTGKIGFNTEWFQIDPQLVNEIWAVTSPGMIDYAVAKTKYAASITSDSFGLEPAMAYAAIYSAAFFEKDINHLVDIGKTALSKESRFSKIIDHVKELYITHPNNWQKAREIIKNNYYVYQDYNRHTWAAVDANMNGALGILALLYGQGDFWKTLDYSCALGMDADNQAATMCGLLGIINGFKSIPHKLMFPIDSLKWEKPFNDHYKMITREGLSDAALTEIASRMAIQGEKTILANGGYIEDRGGEKCYRINSQARFKAPFELNPIPDIVTETGKQVFYPVYTGNLNKVIKTSGKLPKGIKVSNSEIKGIPEEPGKYQFTITAKNEDIEKSIEVKIIVYSKNLAKEAGKVLFNPTSKDKNIEVIRDERTDKTFYSKKETKTQDIDYYGYEWDEPKEISAIVYNNGAAQEFGGWFTTFNVEYLENGAWKKVEFHIDPDMNLDNSQWLKPAFMRFHITFPKIKTKAIRIIGKSGGIEKDAANAHLGKEFYTSITELSVYESLP